MKKKLVYSIVFMLLMFTMTMPVLAGNITGCASVLPNAQIDAKLADVVHTIITVIKIAVPVLLVVFGMLDLAKAMIGNKEDEIKKGQQIFIKRLIVAVIVFFVVSIVQFLISLAAGNESKGIMDCANCFINGSKKCGDK